MATQYYYFISSLPTVHLGEAPPISSEAFLNQCQDRIDPGLTASLAQVNLIPRSDACCPAEVGWNAFETSVRNALARARASRTNRDVQEMVRTEQDAFSAVETQVQEAMAKNPLEMEIHLDRFRWQVLEDLGTGHAFDKNALFIYRMKLLIVEKRASLDPDEAQRKLDARLEAVLEAGPLSTDLGSEETP